MTRILALDLSLTTAGVCRLTDVRAGQPWFEVETVTVPPKRVPGAKLGKLKNEPRVDAERLDWWKRWLIEELACLSGAVAVEDLAFGAPRMAGIAKLMGVIELTLHERDVPLITVPIGTIKKHATGMGNCDKQRMIDTAVERFGEQIRDEHQADAAWLCDYVHAFRLGENGLKQAASAIFGIK